MSENNKKNIVIVTHKLLTHPDDELIVYLNKNKYENVMHICHSFYEAPDRKSYLTWHKRGKLYKTGESKDYMHAPETAIYLKEMFYSIKSILFSGIKWDIYIGMDGMCAFFGHIMKLIGRVKKTIYWAIDFVPKKRFRHEWKNKIYHFVNGYGYTHSDEMWDLSPRMAAAREKYLGLKKSDYKKLQVVPYGLWTDEIKKYPYNKCEKNTLVFMGRMIENQGAQLVVQAIPQIIKKNPNFKFKILGTGPYEDTLIALAKKLKVFKYCEFKGRVPSHRIIESEIAKSCLAVAPYIKKLDKWTYYADPGKVKTYLGCGVPVLLTDIPWNAREIQKNKCGMIISEEVDDIASKILELMSHKNEEYRRNAIKYSKSFNYQNIFSNLNL